MNSEVLLSEEKTQKSNIDTSSDNGEKYLANLLENGAKEFVNEAEVQLPAWYDKDLVLKGQSYLNKYRLIIFNGMLSGLIAVLAIPSILKILIATKQSNTAALAFRRYVRTVYHTISWFQYPLQPGSKSWKSIEMVRRAHLKSSNISDKKNQGKITQKDLALTQFGFMGFYSLHTDTLGLATNDFKSSTVHLWRVIGFLLGIKNEYNLCTDSWDTTKQRLDIIMEKIYKPALEKTTNEFDEMTKILIDGLWPMYHMLDWETSIFFTKHSAKCCNCEYFDTDDFGSGKEKFKEYYKLGWLNRLAVSYGMLFTKKLYPYTIIRIFFNFRLWTYELWAYYLPYLAIYKYGFKWAYTRIFNSKDESIHLHND